MSKLPKDVKLDNKEIFRSLRQGHQKILDDLYEQGRADFLRWAGKRFISIGVEDLLDAWQDSVIAFYEQVVSGKLPDLRCEVRTYLFAIGYKKLLKNNRKIRRIRLKDEIDSAFEREPVVLQFEWDEPWAEERKVLLAALEYLGKQCRELLVQRYYHEKNIEDLQHDMHYTSANSVSASLSRCLKQLKEVIEERWRK